MTMTSLVGFSATTSVSHTVTWVRPDGVPVQVHLSSVQFITCVQSIFPHSFSFHLADAHTMNIYHDRVIHVRACVRSWAGGYMY